MKLLILLLCAISTTSAQYVVESLSFGQGNRYYNQVWDANVLSVADTVPGYRPINMVFLVGMSQEKVMFRN